MRVAAGFIIMLICSLCGMHSSIQLHKRCVLLREIRLLLEHFSIGIACTAPTLEELAGQAQGKFAELLRNCLSENVDFRSAWADAVEQFSQKYPCGSEETELLRELGMLLGTSSAESQLSLLKLYSAQLEKLQEQAEEAAEKKGRLYRSGGVLAGLAAVVLLL